MNIIIREPTTGLHIVGQIKTNLANRRLTSEKAFKLFLSDLIKKYELRELGSFYYKFGETGGFTGIVCLVESHVAIHTWPELKYLTLDVFLCNYSKNNEGVCRSLFSNICKYFNASSVNKMEILR